MRRPKGIKTKKSAAKRFKITGTGKTLFRGAGRRHLLQGNVPNAAGSCERRRLWGQRTFIGSNRTCRSVINARCFTAQNHEIAQPFLVNKTGQRNQAGTTPRTRGTNSRLKRSTHRPSRSRKAMHLKPSHWTCTGKPKTGSAPYLFILNSGALSCMQQPTLESGKALTLLENIFPKNMWTLKRMGTEMSLIPTKGFSC